jgi:hypothetical protein
LTVGNSYFEKLEKECESLGAKAFNAQRNGNIRPYSTLTSESEKLAEKLRDLKKIKATELDLHGGGYNKCTVPTGWTSKSAT